MKKQRENRQPGSKTGPKNRPVNSQTVRKHTTLMNDIYAPIARAVLPERRVYKFRSLADETQKHRLRDIILGHRIRFSRPSELNDPIEGKPIYTLGDWASESYRQTFAEWAWHGQLNVDVPPPREAFMSWILTQPQQVHEQQVAAINVANHEAIESKWRVLSLSATPIHDLMWSHYADGHRGVALVFDASNSEFALAYQVDYPPERMPLDITCQDLTEVLHATLLSKRDSWKYEEEFRCIAPEPWEPDTLKLDAQYLRFKPSQLLGVIFGAKVLPENEAEVVAWAAERETPLTFWKARIGATGSVEVHHHTS